MEDLDISPEARTFIFTALYELAMKIELCGASPELTKAVNFCGLIRQAVGNGYNPPSHYALEKVSAEIHCGLFMRSSEKEIG